jgi:glyoxylase I family protein
MSIDISGLAPLLSVFDMPTAVRFYRDVLGFEVVSDSGGGDAADWMLLRRGGAEVMLNTAYEAERRPPVPDAARMGAHHDTCLFFGCADPDAAWEHLRAHGVSADAPQVAPYGMKQLYVRDPDGYNLCFQCPASDEMRTRWHEWYGWSG